MRRLGLLLLLAACARKDATAPPAFLETTTERGPHALTVRLAPKEPRLSDRLTLTVRLDGPEHVDEPALALDAFEVADQRALPVEVDGDVWTRRWTYRLDPKDAGEHTLGPFTIGGVESEPLKFDVTTVAPPEPRLADLRGALPEIEIPPDRASPWWLLVVLPPLALVAWLLLRRRRAAPERVHTPTELAARELEALLRDDPLARGEFSAFYSELTLIVRRYIERTTGIRAPEQTTPEFLAECRDMPRLGAFLEAADLVKFAAVRPGRDEIDGTVGRAKEFVGLA